MNNISAVIIFRQNLCFFYRMNRVNNIYIKGRNLHVLSYQDNILSQKYESRSDALWMITHLWNIAPFLYTKKGKMGWV